MLSSQILKSKINLKSDVIWFLIWFLTAFFYFMVFQFPHVQIYTLNTYQTRDILRSISLITEGKITWYGPELSGGGHLPGPFYYLLLGVPLIISPSVSGIVVWQFLLASAGCALLAVRLSKLISPLAGTLFTALFISSPLINYQLLVFWNPSFLIFFAALLLFSLKYHETPLHLLIFGFITGLASQIHFTGAIFLLPSIFLILRTKSTTNASRSLNLVSLSAGYLFAISPYILYRLVSNIGDDQSYQITSGIWRLFYRLQMAAYSLLDLNSSYISQKLQFILREPMFLICAVVLFFSFTKLKATLKSDSAKPFLFTLFFSSGSLFFVLSGFAYLRYQIPFFLALCCVVSISLSLGLKSRHRFWSISVIVILVLYATQLFQPAPYSLVKHLAGDPETIVPDTDIKRSLEYIKSSTG